MVECILVPSAKEIYACGAGENIWWSTDDYEHFKESALYELTELIRLYPWLTEKQALILYSKILNLQIHVNTISFLPSDGNDVNTDFEIVEMMTTTQTSSHQNELLLEICRKLSAARNIVVDIIHRVFG